MVMASPSDRDTGDPLEPVLRDVENELKQRLHEACEAEARGISSDGTAEIRHLEDVLLRAAVAAEQSIALRRHIERRAGDPATRAEARPTAPASERTVCAPNDGQDFLPRVREFRDSSGQRWRAWPVTPGQAREGKTAQRYLGSFHKGWICFEALEGSARRRLPQQPARWGEMSDAELIQLLEQAISAPQRKRRESIDPPPTLH
jgi:hypothetical protein